MRYFLNRFANDKVLASASKGHDVYSSLIKETQKPLVPTVCFLDFQGVEVATGSFLRESIFAYRQRVRENNSMVYPVLANLSSGVLEELTMFLQLRGEAFAICSLNKAGVVTNPRIVGVIDGKQQEALLEVLKRVETDAPTLAKTTPDQKPTVWNNRLTALVARGLLMEVGSGKTKRYRPVIEGLIYGT